MTLFVVLGLLLVATLGYISAWFVLARLSNRTDVVDSAWGLGFVYVAWLAYAVTPDQTVVKRLAAVLVTIWGLRLFAHLTKRSIKRPEDYRYVEYRQKWKDSYWQTAYLRIFLTQGLLVWVISLSSIAIILAPRPAWTWLAVTGFVIWGFGILFEAVADSQLRRFMRTRKKGQIMQRGLWRYSRHPNYFGEITTWWGAAIVAVSYQQYWGVIGALVISFLIIKVSGIPPLEKHYADNPAFQKYVKKTSVLLPLPPRQ